MTPITPEQRAYKEKTLNQLLANLSLLEEKLSQESRPDVVTSLENQLEDIQTHINHLQRELATDIAAEPVADQLYQRVARALARGKFYLAKKHISKLETIEPFYPGLDRLRNEAETGRVSRRTRSIAEGTALPAKTAPVSPDLTKGAERRRSNNRTASYVETGQVERQGLFAQFFQFHIIVSCLVVLLIICVIAGVGSVTLLEWLITGG